MPHISVVGDSIFLLLIFLPPCICFQSLLTPISTQIRWSPRNLPGAVTQVKYIYEKSTTLSALSAVVLMVGCIRQSAEMDRKETLPSKSLSSTLLYRSKLTLADSNPTRRAR